MTDPITQKMTTSMRLPLHLKQRLDLASKASGRSLTQEIEMRLELSFDREDTIRRTIESLRKDADNG